jgi:arginyl-tRNA--protein-N-Asp/Glu arginylyltransferase
MFRGARSRGGIFLQALIVRLKRLGNLAKLMSHAQQLNFYASPPERCGYLPEQQAISLFADPDAPMTTALYSRLIDRGFRRSSRYVYRPYCQRCNACVPTRILAARFQPNRSQKRNWKANSDITLSVLPACYREDHFNLYRHYLNTRHADSTMANPTPESYRSFLICEWAQTIFMEFRTQGKLLGVAVTDVLPQGLSAVYTFFDPDQSRRGLGTYAVLRQLAHARHRHLKYVYLGYWITNNSKMSYKTRFQPIEGIIDGKWKILAPK